MSFRINWDADRIISELRSCSAQAASPYNDGFSAWGCKQDLLRVKYALDDMLEQCPYFSDLETKFHEEMSKQKTWQTLKKKV